MARFLHGNDVGLWDSYGGKGAVYDRTSNDNNTYPPKMSSFSGRMKEYGSISIDCFDTNNLPSTCFFLSHCHSDHMRGLDSILFARSLCTKPDTFLYCSAITHQLLCNFGSYDDILPYIKELPCDEPTDIFVRNLDSDQGQTVTVTLIEANHCPGSVMFLFEGSEGTVLYTGDFRFDRHDLTSIRSLHYPSSGKVKKIQSAYVDTTFCVPEAMFIPSREQTSEAVVKLTADWLSVHPDNMVVLNVKARIGYEFLFAQLHETFGMKVHVTEDKLKLYSGIPSITKHVTTDTAITRIHSCLSLIGRNRRHRQCQPHTEGGAVLTMVLSTMWFTQRVNGFDNIVVVKHGRHRVCCSFHSSYAEVREFVSYIHPENVYPNVKPMEYEMDWVQQRLDLFKHISTTAGQGLSQTVRPLGKLRKRKQISPLPPNNGSSMEDLMLSDSPLSKSCKPHPVFSHVKKESLCSESDLIRFSQNSNCSDVVVDSIHGSQLSSYSRHSTDSRENSGSELDLFSDEESEPRYQPAAKCDTPMLHQADSGDGDVKRMTSQSSEKGSLFLTYVSDDDDDGDDNILVEANSDGHGRTVIDGNEEGYVTTMKLNRVKSKEIEMEEFSQWEEMIGGSLEKDGDIKGSIEEGHSETISSRQLHEETQGCLTENEIGEMGGTSRHQRGVTPLLFESSQELDGRSEDDRVEMEMNSANKCASGTGKVCCEESEISVCENVPDAEKPATNDFTNLKPPKETKPDEDSGFVNSEVVSLQRTGISANIAHSISKVDYDVRFNGFVQRDIALSHGSPGVQLRSSHCVSKEHASLLESSDGDHSKTNLLQKPEVIDLTQEEDSDSDATIDYYPGGPDSDQTIDVVVISSGGSSQHIHSQEFSGTPKGGGSDRLCTGDAVGGWASTQDGVDGKFSLLGGASACVSTQDSTDVRCLQQVDAMCTLLSSNADNKNNHGTSQNERDDSELTTDGCVADISALNTNCQKDRKSSEKSRYRDESETSPLFNRIRVSPSTSIPGDSPDVLVYRSPETDIPTDSQISDVHVQYAKGNFSIASNVKRKIRY